jgi:hypothetical protein
LFGSSFYSLALANPRAGLAGHKLWWEAWQQCPAGSLPADDATLCRMSDFGADLKSWARVKTIALHGFILCSDGRYYHPLICREAIAAFERRVRERNRKAKWRAQRDGDEHGGPQDVPRDTTGTRRGQDEDEARDTKRDETVTSALTGQDRTGQDITKERNPPKPPQGGARRRSGFRNGFYALKTSEEEEADGATH